MKVTVIGADRPLGAAVAAGLGEGYEVAAIGAGEGAVDGYRQVDLLTREAMDAELAGVAAIVYTVAFDPAIDDEQTLLDHVARGAYVALTAAVAAGVERAVLLSSLDLVRDYPEEYVVTPQWNAMPRAEAASLAPMLAELAWREIARMGAIDVRCLRLGEIGVETTPDEALFVVRRALTRERQGHYWALGHIASSGRFTEEA